LLRRCAHPDAPASCGVAPPADIGSVTKRARS
jgi:hypothetical protein